MSAYEISTTVGGQGEIHLAGVPFRPGTEVEVIINAKTSTESPAVDTAQRLDSLLASLDRARNNEPIGALNREELYDRDDLR